MITFLAKARRSLLMMVALLATVTTLAAELPAYYPKGGFQGVGTVDAIILEERRIIINDLSFVLADNTVIHTPSAYAVPISRLRIGVDVGYRMVNRGSTIAEIWMLPRGYVGERGRTARHL